MNNKFKLSVQAVGSLMLAVQKGLQAAMMNRPAEECDITKILTDFELEDTSQGLIVLNPPTLEMLKDEDELEDLVS